MTFDKGLTKDLHFGHRFKYTVPSVEKFVEI